MALPPGPSQPALVQTARWIVKPAEFMESCRRRYGDTFTARFVPSRSLVFLSDPDSFRTVLGGDRNHGLASGRARSLQPIMGPRSIFVVEGEDHLARRRLLAPYFYTQRMAPYESLIEEVTAQDIEEWPLGRRFRIHARMNVITLEVILRALFGSENPTLLAELRRLLPQVRDSGRLARGMGLGRALVGRRPPRPAVRRVLERIDQILASEIERRRLDTGSSERRDVLSSLAHAQFEDGERIDIGDVRDQLISLVTAGHRTTATGLAWCFDLLLSRPTVVERLREEIEAGDERYLKAVIREALRVRTVTPVIDRRLGAPVEVDGHSIPAGTDVVLSIHLLHTRPDLYADPHEFRPERFLDGPPDSYSWIPFGGGVRRCVGATFALAEIETVLRTVLLRTELERAGSGPEPIARQDVQFAPKHGTPAILKRRL